MALHVPPVQSLSRRNARRKLRYKINISSLIKTCMTRFGLMAVRRDDTCFVPFPRAAELLTLFWENNPCLVIRKKEVKQGELEH